MATEYELTLLDYLLIMRRRAPYLIGIFITVLVVSIIAAIVIQPTYRATGIIMVESQQASESIVSSTIKTQLEDQINSIKQRVMTRENLLQLANKHNLFKGDAASTNSSGLIDGLRNRIEIEIGDPNEKHTNQQGKQALEFSVSFDDKQADVAFQVANDLIDLFLKWNVKIRIEGATETKEFLTQEAEKLKVEVDRLEKLIAEFKQKNKNALPEQLTLRMTMLSRAENDLREVERDIRSTKEELRSLEVELTAAKHGTGDEAQTLPALRAELSRLLAVYKESHPDIRRLKLKIEAMEKPSEFSSAGDDAINSLSPAVYRIQAKIDSDKARLISLTQQREMLQRKMSENESAMILTPKVEQELSILIRDRDSAQKKFEELRNKRMNAKIAETLESESLSGRFSVLEPPLLPEKPYKPSRVKIVIIGFFLALALSGGVVTLLETIDKRVRGIEALTHVLGSRPLVSIPYIHTKEDEARRKLMLKLAIKIGIATSVVVTVILIVTLLIRAYG